MKTIFARFLKDESGATAVEYALIVAGIGLAIMTAVRAAGTSISGAFENIAAQVK